MFSVVIAILVPLLGVENVLFVPGLELEFPAVELVGKMPERKRTSSLDRVIALYIAASGAEGANVLCEFVQDKSR